MRSGDKMQAVADYAAGVGVVTLSDGHGRVVTSGYVIPRELLHGELLGALEPVEVSVGAFTLRIRPTLGMSPAAVARRVAGCKRLMRLLPAPVPPVPPRDGGGSGPASAELRVWPDARKR